MSYSLETSVEVKVGLDATLAATLAVRYIMTMNIRIVRKHVVMMKCVWDTYSAEHQALPDVDLMQ